MFDIDPYKTKQKPTFLRFPDYAALEKDDEGQNPYKTKQNSDPGTTFRACLKNVIHGHCLCVPCHELRNSFWQPAWDRWKGEKRELKNKDH